MKRFIALLLMMVMVLTVSVGCKKQEQAEEAASADTYVEGAKMSAPQEESKPSVNRPTSDKTEEDPPAEKQEQQTPIEKEEQKPAEPEGPKDEPAQQEPTDDEVPKEQEGEEEQEKPDVEHMLDGKKILFIGNSFTYYGNAVMLKRTYDLESRINDNGLFYQLCAENGAEVSVTNWTFPGHFLSHLLSDNCSYNNCTAGSHFDHLTDRYYDYVIVQEGGGGGGEALLEHCRKIKEMFLEVNPNAEFFFLNHSYSYFSYGEAPDRLEDLRKEGYQVIDWGGLVYDVASGTTDVPGAQYDYNKNTFIVSRHEGDGYHPNMLSGYLTSLMTYCAITGESAVGQPYAFCDDSSINYEFDLLVYEYNYYQYSPSNFVEVFGSEADMKGLQKLADQYLAKWQ
ncbi:MAG: hypothetical protein IJ333_08330 [Clostridia bacterium]|nr:hypothetical protein [Clostridia bacterium]